MPPGIFPPNVMQYDASSVPILQLGLSSNTLTEQQLFDFGQNFIRTRLSTVNGIAVPLPYGGEGCHGQGGLGSAPPFGKGVWAAGISASPRPPDHHLPPRARRDRAGEYLTQPNTTPPPGAA